MRQTSCMFVLVLLTQNSPCYSPLSTFGASTVLACLPFTYAIEPHQCSLPVPILGGLVFWVGSELKLHIHTSVYEPDFQGKQIRVLLNWTKHAQCECTLKTKICTFFEVLNENKTKQTNKQEGLHLREFSLNIFLLCEDCKMTRSS